jgi:NADPH-dependent 2,4-dienoyl-CoA reductase/sulfur reductase-like enzyme
MNCSHHPHHEEAGSDLSEGYEALDIAIVGAGIAGLGAAIALCRNGHNVEVGIPTAVSSITDE